MRAPLIRWPGRLFWSALVMGAISGCGAGGGDPCDAIMAGTVRFDLRPLAQACRRAYQSASGTIALRLADAPMLTYEF